MLRRLLVVLVSAVVLSACGSDDPVELLLNPDDVDAAFTAEEVVEDAPFILRGCEIEGLGNDIDGAETASITFNDASTGDGFTHTVSRVGNATSGDVLAEVQELLGSCEPQELGGAGGLTTLFVREATDGPELGDESLWMATHLQIEGGAEDGPTGETPSVIFTEDGVVHFLSGPVDMPWEESVAFVVDLAESL